MGSRLTTKYRTGTALATGAAVTAAAVTCGGFAMESSRSARRVEQPASGPAAAPTASRQGTEAPFAGIANGQLGVRIGRADISSPAPGGAVSYLIHVRPPGALIPGVTIVAAARPGMVTVKAACAAPGPTAASSGQAQGGGHAQRAGAGSRKAGSRTAPPGQQTLAESVLHALGDTPGADDGPAPAITSCTLGPAAAPEAGAGLLVTVRIPDHVAAGRLVLLAVGAAEPANLSAGSAASGGNGESACAADAAGTCEGGATATAALRVAGPVSHLRPVLGRVRSAPERGAGPAAGPAHKPGGGNPEARRPSPESSAPAPRRSGPAPELPGPSPEPSAPSPELTGQIRELAAPAQKSSGPTPQRSRPSPVLSGASPEPSTATPEFLSPSPGPCGAGPEPSDPAKPSDPAEPSSPTAGLIRPTAPRAPVPVTPARPDGQHPGLSGASPEPSGPGPKLRIPTPELISPSPGLSGASPEPTSPSPGRTAGSGTSPTANPGVDPGAGGRAGGGAEVATTSAQAAVNRHATGRLPSAPPSPARPSPAQPSPAQPSPAQPSAAQSPAALAPPGPSGGIPTALPEPAPDATVPANIAPALPRISPQQAPSAGQAATGKASSGPLPEDEAADSGELPTPIGLAAAQILGLAVALSAALVALLRPFGLAGQPQPAGSVKQPQPPGLAKQPRSRWHRRLSGMVKPNGEKKPPVAGDESDPGGFSGTKD